jgi:hypothetical protein
MAAWGHIKVFGVLRDMQFKHTERIQSAGSMGPEVAMKLKRIRGPSQKYLGQVVNVLRLVLRMAVLSSLVSPESHEVLTPTRQSNRHPKWRPVPNGCILTEPTSGFRCCIDQRPDSGRHVSWGGSCWSHLCS